MSLGEAAFTQFLKAFPRSELTDIAESLASHASLNENQALRLFTTHELPALSFLAHQVRTELHGNKTWYVINRHINYSNVCADVCLFCSYSRDVLTADRAYEMSLDEILERASELDALGARELHIVGGNHPDLPWSYYTDMISAIHQRHPQVGIKAFTAVEITHFSQRFNRPVSDILSELKEAGLSSLPGGGAEIFADRVRKKICRTKANADQWLDVHRTAHHLGLATNATMLFGTIETMEERVDHLMRLRQLQSDTRGFTAFIPLAYHNEGNRLDKLAAPGGVDKLRTIAASRLILDNFPHIKAYWIMLGVSIASLAQRWGASDLDGTVVEEKIYHMAGARTPQEMARTHLEDLITSEGFVPVERDNIYNPVSCV